VALNELDGETPAGQWQPKEMAEDWKELAWDVSAAVKQAGSYEAAFWYARGKHRLGIERAALYEDGKELSSDAHYGVTGAQHKDNLYVLKAVQVKPQARYELRARVRSEGGTDSYGEVYLRRLERPK
jgi:hexosaminidase